MSRKPGESDMTSKTFTILALLMIAGHAGADHAAQLFFERWGGGDLIRAEGGRDTLPKPVQPVVQQRPLARLGSGEGFGDGQAASGAAWPSFPSTASAFAAGNGPPVSNVTNLCGHTGG